MSAPHAARLVAVREAAFHQFASPPQQTLAVDAAHPSPILVHSLLLLALALPVALPRLFLFWNVSTHLVTLHPLQDRAAVVNLVRYHLFDSLDVDLGRILGSLLRCLAFHYSATATTAPVSRSTACSALCAKCVRPSFIFVIRASPSAGLSQSLFGIRFFRLRSNRAKSSRFGVSMPEAFARPRKNSS